MATTNPQGKDERLETTVDLNADAGNDIEIEVIDDTPPKDRGRKPLDKKVDDPTEAELDEYSKGVRQRIKDLTHARHDERREKETIAREREELAALSRALLAENTQLKKSYNAGAQAYSTVSTEAATAAVSAAKAKLKLAKEAFDSDAEVEALAELTEATQRLSDAKKFKPTPLQVEKEEVQQRQAQQAAVQPDEKTLSWQADNQWFGAQGFEEYTSYALGLHQRLVNSGVNPKSDEYFAQIDARMKRTFPELYDEGDDASDKPTTATKKPPTVVAPAQRTPATGAGPGKVRLTSTQLATAKKLGITPQQYAAQVVKLQQSER